MARDPVAQAEEVGELVEHLVLDHRRFHVGDEQPLAPAVGRDEHGIDAGHTQTADRRTLERDVAGDLGCEPVGRADVGTPARRISTAACTVRCERRLLGGWRVGRGYSSPSGSSAASGQMEPLAVPFDRKRVVRSAYSQGILPPHGQAGRHRRHRTDRLGQVGAGAPRSPSGAVAA